MAARKIFMAVNQANVDNIKQDEERSASESRAKARAKEMEIRPNKRNSDPFEREGKKTCVDSATKACLDGAQTVGSAGGTEPCFDSAQSVGSVSSVTELSIIQQDLRVLFDQVIDNKAMDVGNNQPVLNAEEALKEGLEMPKIADTPKNETVKESEMPVNEAMLETPKPEEQNDVPKEKKQKNVASKCEETNVLGVGGPTTGVGCETSGKQQYEQEATKENWENLLSIALARELHNSDVMKDLKSSIAQYNQLRADTQELQSIMKAHLRSIDQLIDMSVAKHTEVLNEFPHLPEYPHGEIIELYNQGNKDEAFVKAIEHNCVAFLCSRVNMDNAFELPLKLSQSTMLLVAHRLGQDISKKPPTEIIMRLQWIVECVKRLNPADVKLVHLARNYLGNLLQSLLDCMTSVSDETKSPQRELLMQAQKTYAIVSSVYFLVCANIF